ncbi:hypothetical protein N7510_003041 [Penicillium lagena]|uniref:uncharacterized protein n=1 Tax=Penicillium lagena TaxID=94218 RepID=UPI00254249A5|nr:uncharacterized protein N7510_003041 [Penicillium lagena]KAJ5619057.1 hypothetical protein N7510_003041 [Penicillium lagena]
MEVYDSEPWYVSDSFTHRWGLKAILRRLVGAGYPSEGFMPQGYLIEEVGPMNMIGKGLEECDKGTRRLIKADRGGCPFAVSKN